LRNNLIRGLLVALLAIPLPTLAAGTGTIRGVVVDARDGAPLARVSVRVQDTGAATTTAADGRFEISDLPGGPHDVVVSAINFSLVRRTVAVPEDAVVDVTVALVAGTGGYSETVNVEAAGKPAEDAAEGVQRLSSTNLEQLGSVVAADPMRAIQALPGVVATDDYRSEFSVHGLGADHMTFTFEGAAAPLLVHTLPHVVNAGSVAMVSGDVLDSASLETGAHDERYGGRLGAELDFRMREGSRDRTHVRASASIASASATGEGPIGPARRGSWLLSFRRSYVEQLVKHFSPDQSLLFGFWDAQGKFVYDVSPREQVQFAFTTGSSHTEEPDTGDFTEITHGVSDTTLGVLTLRSLLTPRMTLVQKITASVNTAHEQGPFIGLDAGGHDLAYRADFALSLSGPVVLEAGVEAARASQSEDYRQTAFGEVGADRRISLRQGAYVSSRLATRFVTMESGVRVDHWNWTSETVASPWARVTTPLARPLAFHAGLALLHQPPALLDATVFPSLHSEHADEADAGLGGRIAAGVRWDISAYDRRDRSLVRQDIGEGKLGTTGGVFATVGPAYLGAANALDGRSRGFEIALRKETSRGLSGWIAYDYGRTKYHDTTTGEDFFGDADQRNTVNAFALYPLSARTSVNARFRYGSNTPVIGYWTERDGRYFLASARNTLRLPPYSRLDVRLDRTYIRGRARITAFVEVTNVYNRDNLRQSGGQLFLRGTSLETLPPFERLTPLIPAVGLLVEF